MDFYNILQEKENGQTFNPFAGKRTDGEWIAGTVSVNFLNTHFSQYSTADEMINATDSEGLKKYFQWLKDEGKLK